MSLNTNFPLVNIFKKRMTSFLSAITVKKLSKALYQKVNMEILVTFANIADVCKGR